MDYHNNKLFSQRLRSEMDRAGLDASTLAKELGFSKSAVSNWLNQKHSAQSYALERLGGYFGVEPAWLAGAIPYRTISSNSPQSLPEDISHADSTSAESHSYSGSCSSSAGRILQSAAVREQADPTTSTLYDDNQAPKLTDGDRMVISAYLNAPPDSKEAIQSFVRSLLKHR